MRHLFIAAAGGALMIPTPLEAQTIPVPANRELDFTVVLRDPVISRTKPTFIITERVDENKDLSLEYQHSADRYRSIEDNMRLKVQIAPDADIKWKGAVGARLTIRFK